MDESSQFPVLSQGTPAYREDSDRDWPEDEECGGDCSDRCSVEGLHKKIDQLFLEPHISAIMKTYKMLERKEEALDENFKKLNIMLNEIKGMINMTRNNFSRRG